MAKAVPIPSLTGLRGVAAAAAALFHFRQQLYPLLSISRRLPCSGPISRGWHAVDLFFMLSGFILMHVHEQDFCAWKPRRLIQFAWLRFTRIYPLNTVVLLLIVVLAGLQPNFVQHLQTGDPRNFGLPSFLRTLTLTTRFPLTSRGEWNGVTWSLSLEVLAYIAFPFLAFLVGKVDRLWTCVGLLATVLVGLSGFSFLAYHDLNDGAVEGWGVIVRTGVGFSVGVLIKRLADRLGPQHVRMGALLAGVGAIGVLLSIATAKAEVLFNVSFAVLLLGLSYQEGRVAWLLSRPLTLFLGRISFPFYLVHFILLQWVGFLVIQHQAAISMRSQVEIAGAWLIGCLLLSVLLHHLVEVPTHRLGRRIGSFLFRYEHHSFDNVLPNS